MWEAVQIRTGYVSEKLLTDEERTRWENHSATRGKYKFIEVKEQTQEPTPYQIENPVGAEKAAPKKAPAKRGRKRTTRKKKTE